MSLLIRPMTENDIQYVRDVFISRWDADFVVSRGKKHIPEDLDGFIATMDGKNVGLLTYKIKKAEMEIISLDSFQERSGVGTALINQTIKTAKSHGVHRLVVVTTNDNLDALQFYQRRGFCLSKVYPKALEESRKIKPSIPLIGEHSIPLRDEIELEMML